ncbi:unnamed protein product [Amoebophrya sp. A120]|nr:unnamed protein product [Amoebophrya sp. A120]|eukprot:GSA120T00013963001.1
MKIYVFMKTPCPVGRSAAAAAFFITIALQDHVVKFSSGLRVQEVARRAVAHEVDEEHAGKQVLPGAPALGVATSPAYPDNLVNAVSAADEKVKKIDVADGATLAAASHAVHQAGDENDASARAGEPNCCNVEGVDHRTTWKATDGASCQTLFTALNTLKTAWNTLSQKEKGNALNAGSGVPVDLDLAEKFCREAVLANVRVLVRDLDATANATAQGNACTAVTNVIRRTKNWCCHYDTDGITTIWSDPTDRAGSPLSTLCARIASEQSNMEAKISNLGGGIPIDRNAVPQCGDGIPFEIARFITKTELGAVCEAFFMCHIMHLPEDEVNDDDDDDDDSAESEMLPDGRVMPDSAANKVELDAACALPLPPAEKIPAAVEHEGNKVLSGAPALSVLASPAYPDNLVNAVSAADEKVKEIDVADGATLAAASRAVVQAGDENDASARAGEPNCCNYEKDHSITWKATDGASCQTLFTAFNTLKTAWDTAPESEKGNAFLHFGAVVGTDLAKSFCTEAALANAQQLVGNLDATANATAQGNACTAVTNVIHRTKNYCCREDTDGTNDAQRMRDKLLGPVGYLGTVWSDPTGSSTLCARVASEQSKMEAKISNLGDSITSIDKNAVPQCDSPPFIAKRLLAGASALTLCGATLEGMKELSWRRRKSASRPYDVVFSSEGPFIPLGDGRRR